jgi:hypothetical protein
MTALSTADTIADIIGVGVAAYLREHPQILELAGQARARADRARAQRDLDLLAAEIVAAGHHLDELRRKQERLRAIAGGLLLADTGREQHMRQVSQASAQAGRDAEPTLGRSPHPGRSERQVEQAGPYTHPSAI